MTEADINGDLTRRVAVDTTSMDWSPSPSPKVWRKRVHRVGPAESGQVTSVVRYGPGSAFPAHPHPEGEEILVLDGVFSDDRGDWPAGTYLLNPEGYSHAPSSRDGCELFVRLRQYPGLDRDQVAIDTQAMPWQPGDRPGIEIKLLYAQPGYSDSMRLERWSAGAGTGRLTYPDGIEYFVLEGAFSDSDGRYEVGSWLRLPAGSGHTPATDTGCTLYARRGGQQYLR